MSAGQSPNQAEPNSAESDSHPLVPQELADEYLRVRNLPDGFVEAKRLYFAEIMPRIRPALEDQDVHRELRSRGYETLVSLMGFSPETTVQTALILRPKKLTIVLSDGEKARSAAGPAVRYLRDVGLVDELGPATVAVRPFDPHDIYNRIRKTLLSANRDSVVLDVTGGTKVMSATAGALAWEMNVPLVYLEGGWDPNAGAAGLHRLACLKHVQNPSRERGYELRRAALRAYQRGNFAAASEVFEQSRELISESYFDHLGTDLCRCYCAMADFDRAGLGGTLDRLRETLKHGGVRALYEGRLTFDEHLSTLQRLADGEFDAMTAAFLTLADMYTRQQRYDFAGLLAYRAMEALVEMGLKRIDPNFSVKKPNWELLGDPVDLTRKFVALSKGKDRALPERVSLQDGFGMLCILSDIGKRFMDAGNNKNAVGKMMGLAEKRNRSYLAHDFKNLTASDSQNVSRGVDELARAVLGDDYAEFRVVRQQLRPIHLETLWRES